MSQKTKFLPFMQGRTKHAGWVKGNSILGNPQEGCCEPVRENEPLVRCSKRSLRADPYRGKAKTAGTAWQIREEKQESKIYIVKYEGRASYYIFQHVSKSLASWGYGTSRNRLAKTVILEGGAPMKA